MKLKDWFNTNKEIFLDRDLRFLIKNTFNNTVFVLDSRVVIDEQKVSYLDGVKDLYIKGMPMAYILGKEEFFGLEFRVSPDVLIPRKETELIVEKAIDIVKKNKLKSALDLCCGSGNIAVSMKTALAGGVSLVSSDISLKALDLARFNARYHKADISFVQADMLAGFKRESFDLIVSNPPYVEEEAIKGSLSYEPRLALHAPDQGLYFIRKILQQSHMYLKPKGYLIVEMGYKHRQEVEHIANNTGFYKIIEWVKDYSAYWRGAVLQVIKN